MRYVWESRQIEVLVVIFIIGGQPVVKFELECVRLPTVRGSRADRYDICHFSDMGISTYDRSVANHRSERFKRERLRVAQCDSTVQVSVRSARRPIKAGCQVMAK